VSTVLKAGENDQNISVTEMFRMVALYLPETMIKIDQQEGSTSETSWLVVRVYLALKRCGSESPFGSLFQNEF